MFVILNEVFFRFDKLLLYPTSPMPEPVEITSKAPFSSICSCIVCDEALFEGL
jgi:hypothetical protein